MAVLHFFLVNSPLIYILFSMITILDELKFEKRNYLYLPRQIGTDACGNSYFVFGYCLEKVLTPTLVTNTSIRLNLLNIILSILICRKVSLSIIIFSYDFIPYVFLLCSFIRFGSFKFYDFLWVTLETPVNLQGFPHNL